MKFSLLMISLIVTAWVFFDARERGKGIFVAFLWCLGTQLLTIIFLPLWLINRPERCQKVVIIERPAR
jgi:hypothetical protein